MLPVAVNGWTGAANPENINAYNFDDGVLCRRKIRMDIKTILNRTTAKVTLWMRSPPATPSRIGMRANTAAANPLGTSTARRDASSLGIDLGAERRKTGMRITKIIAVRISPIKSHQEFVS